MFFQWFYAVKSDHKSNVHNIFFSLILTIVQKKMCIQTAWEHNALYHEQNVKLSVHKSIIPTKVNAFFLHYLCIWADTNHTEQYNYSL